MGYENRRKPKEMDEYKWLEVSRRCEKLRNRKLRNKDQQLLREEED